MNTHKKPFAVVRTLLSIMLTSTWMGSVACTNGESGGDDGIEAEYASPDERSHDTNSSSTIDSLEQDEWAGSHCARPRSLRNLVDDVFAGEPSVAGISVALHKPGCGTFVHARGQRDVARDKPMTPATKVHIASLTKPVTGALVLFALERGLFGPLGLDTPIDAFLAEEQIESLTSNCSDDFEIQAIDRETFEFAPALGICPDFSAITLWHLVRAHDGNLSFEEIDTNRNGLGDALDYSLGAWFRAVGFPTLPPLASEPSNSFEVLDAVNIYRHNTAVIGGTTIDDFPISAGNTQYQLLGMILEEVSARSYEALVKRHITDRLHTGQMILLTGIPSVRLERTEQISRGYADVTGASSVLPEFDENTNGVYPVMQVRRRPVVDMYDFDSFTLANGAGGAGALVATTKSYVTFFRKLVTGGLLSPAMQTVFEQGFSEIGVGPDVTYGFGVLRGENNPDLGTIFVKNGALFGAVCLAAHITASQVTVVVCANGRDIFESQVEGALVPTLLLDLETAAR